MWKTRGLRKGNSLSWVSRVPSIVLGRGTDRMPQEYGLVMKQWGTALPPSKMSTLDQRLPLRKLISGKQGHKDWFLGSVGFAFMWCTLGLSKIIMCFVNTPRRIESRMDDSFAG